MKTQPVQFKAKTMSKRKTDAIRKVANGAASMTRKEQEKILFGDIPRSGYGDKIIFIQCLLIPKPNGNRVMARFGERTRSEIDQYWLEKPGDKVLDSYVGAGIDFKDLSDEAAIYFAQEGIHSALESAGYLEWSKKEHAKFPEWVKETE